MWISGGVVEAISRREMKAALQSSAHLLFRVVLSLSRSEGREVPGFAGAAGRCSAQVPTPQLQVCPSHRCWHLGGCRRVRTPLVLNSLLLIPDLFPTAPFLQLQGSKPPSSSSPCPEVGYLIPGVSQLHTWMLDFDTSKKML